MMRLSAIGYFLLGLAIVGVIYLVTSTGPTP